MNPNLYSVILAGGRGERFWPQSRTESPKQFLSLFGGVPLIRQAAQRLNPLVRSERTFVITSANLVELTRTTLPEIPPENIVGEPMGRDTAAAVALACGLIRQRDPDGVVCIFPADALITNTEGFQQTIATAGSRAAVAPAILTIGIPPSYPATGFGYIQAGEIRVEGSIRIRAAERFVEKPNVETAEGYLRDGHYLWNAGIFIWHVRTMAAALRAHAPEVAAMSEAIAQGTPDQIDRLLSTLYPPLPRISVDYAVMEKVDNIEVVDAAFDWDDVGTWTALPSYFPQDELGNTALGKLSALDAKGNIVLSQDRLTALIGVDDLVVVHAGNATLVCPKARVGEIKKLLAQVAERSDATDYL